MKSPFSKTLVAILFAATLVITPKLVKAQDYTEEEYKVFQDVQAEKDDAKKIDMIVAFLKEKPKNSLRPNMIAEGQKVIVELSNAKKMESADRARRQACGRCPQRHHNDQFLDGSLL